MFFLGVDCCQPLSPKGQPWQRVAGREGIPQHASDATNAQFARLVSASHHQLDYGIMGVILAF